VNQDPDFQAITSNFQLKGEFQNAVPYGEGHIHITYAATFREFDGGVRRYILQCINREVFKKPEEVMHNIECVTEHIRSKVLVDGGDPARKTIQLVSTKDGASYYKSADRDYWRAHHFIEGAQTYLQPLNHHHIYNSGRAFGEFLTLVSDLPAAELFETIPDFHNTPKSFQDLVDIVEQDPVNRAQTVKNEIEFVVQRDAEVRIISDLMDQGIIPERVTHNDTKIDNVMIDDDTGEGVCVIDLDTVMPGLSVFDFGDTVRSGANRAAEDEPDLSKVIFDIDIFDVLAKGFLAATLELLTPAEVDHLAFGAKIITLEQGIRFLADYLNGDVYYKTHRPNHNLDRARTQLKLVFEMEEQFEAMEAIIRMHG